MRYDLVVDGVRFPGQQHSGGLDPQTLLNREYGRFVKEGIVSYLHGGAEESVLINWGRVSSVQVVITDGEPDA